MIDTRWPAATGAQGMAKLVCEHLGGSAASPLALRSQWEVMRAQQNANGTAERLVAVGERRSCSTLRHRLLLFKLLAPLVGDQNPPHNCVW